MFGEPGLDGNFSEEKSPLSRPFWEGILGDNLERVSLKVDSVDVTVFIQLMLRNSQNSTLTASLLAPFLPIVNKKISSAKCLDMLSLH
jgi:hypothetical protein